MRKIVILDTLVNDTNLGNAFIMEAVHEVLNGIFPHDFIYHVPALEYVRAGRDMVRQANYIFLAGTNLLSSDMNSTSDWRLRITDMLWLKDVILLGVGWWQYQAYPPNLYTRLLLKRVLSREYYHSVRDSYTANKSKGLGFKVLNTGCPTVWGLTNDHCAGIPQDRAENALLTFTEYSQCPKDDKLLFKIVARNYRTVYFWPQMYGDYSYAKEICQNKVVFIDPSVKALDDFLQRQRVDCIGTRLHGGIRALQHKRRTIIVGVDNRAIELGGDVNLPLVLREKIALQLEDKINSSWSTEVRLDRQAINAWQKQFNPF